MATKVKRVVSATYDKRSGLLQRTLNNGTTVSILFASVGVPTTGKKGLYLDFPKAKDMVGQTFPVAINNGKMTYPGLIRIKEYTTENHGSYRVVMTVGRSKKEKLLKNHDLATLWCVATDFSDLMNAEERKLLKKIERAAKKTAATT